MANTALKGFAPYLVKGGGPVTYRRGRVLTNNTTAIFLGDCVVRAATGDYVVMATGTTAVESVQYGGCAFTNSAGTRVFGKFLPAATLYTSTGVYPDNASYIWFVDNVVNTAFTASVDAAIALTDLNLNYAVTLTAGSTATGLSGHVLTATGRAVTATIPWRVEEFVFGSPINDVDLINAAVVCYVNAAFDEPALTASLGA